MAEMNETDRQAAHTLAELARESTWAAPERIWLQWYGDGDPEIDDGPVSTDDVTWAQEQIFKHDFEYVQNGPHQRLKDAVVEAAKARHQFYEARTGQDLSVELANAEWKAVRALLEFEKGAGK